MATLNVRLRKYLEELKVEVHGDFLPRHFFGMFHIIFAALRSLFLATYIYFFTARHYDLIIVDQISYGIPILRHCAERTLFYCHFPDKLLAPRTGNPLRMLYRVPFDYWEARTILQADRIVVNSQFTAEQFVKSFPETRLRPTVLSPGVPIIPMEQVVEARELLKDVIPKDEFLLLSLNRFEEKKNIGLAIHTYKWLLDRHPAVAQKTRLVIAGTSISLINALVKILQADLKKR